MSAKLLYSIADDNAAVQKQLGCMNGIFQIFYRHHFLSPRVAKDPNKRLTDGHGGKHNIEVSETSRDVRNSKAVIEKRRISTDSSRSSISSSCNSSSLSSLDDTRSVKSERVEKSSFRQSSTAEIPLTRGPTRLNGSDSMGKQPRSDHRDARSIMVKTGKKEESPTLTYIDSPRPVQKPSKPAKPRFSSIQESLGALPNFRKLRTSTDSTDHSRKDSPRLSYDGRESRDSLKSNARLKEMPRHSLDSKRGSIIASPQIRHNDLTVESPRETGTHRRQSSLVAKLMGLEDFPDPMPGLEELSSSASGETFDNFSRSSRNSYGASRSSQPTEIIPQQQGSYANNNFPKKMNPSMRFPMEPAPWKKVEGNQSGDAPQNTTRSVYGEIEKRLAQLEFKKSGKDLRALKQILEAMQKSEKMDTQKEVEKIDTPSPRTRTEAILRNVKCESPSSPMARRTISPKTSTSSTVAMKPDTRKKPKDGSKEAVSPRVQKKKFDPLDYSHRRSSQVGGQKRSSGLQDRNQRSRSNSFHQGGYDQGSEISGDSISRDSVSLQSEGNISTISRDEAEVTSTYRGDSWMGKRAFSPPLREDLQIRKPQMSTPEQPSPISVLDPTLYGDESPSPVKMISNAFEDLNSDESRWEEEDLKSPSISKEPSFSSELARCVDTGFNFSNPDHKYISEILALTGLMRDQDYKSVNSRPNPPHHLFNRKLFLALEQIKARDWLSDGNREIPQLKRNDRLQRRLVFDVVNELLVEKFVSNDHSKNWLGKGKNNQHTQQWLLHGLCSEIDRLQATSSACSSDEEGDGLSHIVEKDLSNQTAVWEDGFGDISGVVLDIERLIFKDLVSEVVSGAASQMVRARHSTSYCRQLF